MLDLGHSFDLAATHRGHPFTRKRLNQKGSFHALETCLVEPHLMGRMYFIARRKQIESIGKFKKHQRKTRDLVAEASIANNFENFTVNNVHFSLQTTSHCWRNKLGLFFPKFVKGRDQNMRKRNYSCKSQFCDSST